MHWLRQIMTGADNQTLAVGRVLGIIVFAVFLIGLPIAALVTMAAKEIPATDWASVIDKLQVYVPSICLAVGGLIGLTANAEPKRRDDD